MNVGGRDVFYRRSTGPADAVPIVHVHGFGISGSYLMPTARLLVRHGVNLVPDLPGYGRSDRRDHTLDIPELAEALLALLDALGLDKVVLVGNSMGCPVSLEVAHAAPERVDRLVLVSPAGGIHNQPLPRALVQLARTAPARRRGWRGWPFPTTCASARSTRCGCSSQLTAFPSLERLLHAPVPTLAVLGSRDPLMPRPAAGHRGGPAGARARDGRRHPRRGARDQLQPPRRARQRHLRLARGPRDRRRPRPARRRPGLPRPARLTAAGRLLVLLVPDPGPLRLPRVLLGVLEPQLAADAEPHEHEAEPMVSHHW